LGLFIDNTKPLPYTNTTNTGEAIMFQWLYQLLMSKQDKQVVAQIIQLWLAKPEAFVVRRLTNGSDSIQASLFNIRLDLDDGGASFGEMRLKTGWCARKILAEFATQQALLSFHQNAAEKLLADEDCTGEIVQKPVVMVKDQYLPPFREKDIRKLNGKMVAVETRGDGTRTGTVSIRDSDVYKILYRGDTFTLGGRYYNEDATSEKDIISITIAD
jgi:hypothetical protein